VSSDRSAEVVAGVASGAVARPAIVVSACLCGVAGNHEGRPARVDLRDSLTAKGFRVFPICPEFVGGLPTPRTAAEIQPGDGVRVLDRDGVDVTAAYERGARQAVELARAVGAERAVLKARSPSCGSGRVYDGTFTRTLVDGDGVTARALRGAGLAVTSDEDDLPEAPSVAG
jgi:uncharacterized protein YbbK (DUF523 family)